MALTFEQLGQRVKQTHPEYNDLSDYEVGSRVVSKYPQYRDMVETPNVPQETQNPGVISRFFTGIKDTVPKLGNELLQRGRNIVSAFKSGTQYEPDKGIVGNAVQGGLTPLHVAGQVAGAVGDVIGAGAGIAYKTAVSEPTQQKIQGHVLDILNTPEGQTGLNALKQGMDYYQRFKEANPETAKSLEDVLNIATVAPGVKVAKEGVREVKNIANDAIDLTARITKRGEDAIGKAIDSGIEKGVRPSVVGKKTAQQMESYKQSARTAVLAITKNKNNLSFLNDAGESIKGAVPTSLKEFADSVEQTKKTIFKKYDSLAKKAGESGGKVELSNVADELRKVGQDNVLKDLYPDVVSYAEKRAESLSKRASYSTEEAQTAIKHLNESLQAFYRNPTFESASKAQIDAMIANNIRTSLDNVVTNATGEGYSALKKVYGSLKSIEKDVAHRSIVDARKNVKGLIDFTDIFSAGDIISGIATMNPAQIAKGGFQKAIATVYKKLNDPNRTIKKMFQGAEKYIQRKETPFTPKSYTGKAVQSMKGKGGMSIQDVSGGKAGYSNALTQEAKKYKSAEEFVKAQGTHVYHGTNAEFDKFDISKATNTQYGKGIYFTENPKITKQYGKKTIEVYLDKNSVLTLNEPLSTEQKNNLRKVIGKDEWDWSKNPTGEFVWNRLELTHKNPEELLIKAGIKGVQHNQQTVNGTNKNFVIFDESAIRTKSQLTDIWKKAHGETKRGFGTGAGRTAGESKGTLVKDASTKIDNYIANLKPKFMELDAMDALDELKKMKTQLSQKSLKAQDVKDIVGDADKLVKETIIGRAKKLAPEIKSETDLNKLTLEAKKNRYFDEFKKLHPNVDAGVLKSIFIRSRK